MAASVDVLTEGYADDRVASTVVLIRDGDLVAIVDPGMVVDRTTAILKPLAGLGVDPGDVTDVVLSHHHPDHTVNAALFVNARIHDYQAIYDADVWTDREAEGFRLSESVWLLETPGHTPQDVSTLATTAAGLVVCTHLWWYEGGPDEDPYAPDASLLMASRQRILDLRPALIVPGHGAAFAPA